VIRRATLLAMEFAGALLAGLILLLAFLTWRMTNEGPIHLAFLKPYVEDMLNRGGRQYGFVIGDVVLAWAGWEGVIDVRAIDVQVLNSQGRTRSCQAFLWNQRRRDEGGPAGAVADQIFRPELSLYRNSDGDFGSDPR
jgi:hypothetical protein